MTSEARECRATIDGPKVGRVVAWRDYCGNKTTDASGRCRYHRPGVRALVGETNEEALERNSWRKQP
jgi:hypothetical protein